MADLTFDSANEFRRAVGDLVRAVRLGEHTPEGQIETLGFLARDGAQSIATLARRRRVRHQSMSAMIADFELRGLVTRSADPDDARGVLLQLTGAGTEMVHASRLRRSTVLLEAARTALTPSEREALAGIPGVLDTLSDALMRAAEDTGAHATT
jgi:DNA-binding MarR family transcriptional regulator